MLVFLNATQIYIDILSTRTKHRLFGNTNAFCYNQIIMWSIQRLKGFTIVELLIVIVVIAILAAISIVAYNGIQSRAKNTKTINATTAWIKAIKMYNTDTGNWPVNSCLGTTSTYSGESSQCWDGAGWVVVPGFLSALQPYMSSQPEPDSSNLHTTGDVGSPKKGAFFYNASTTEKQIYMMQPNSTTCPNLSAPVISQTVYGNGVRCIYRIS